MHTHALRCRGPSALGRGKPGSPLRGTRTPAGCPHLPPPAPPILPAGEPATASGHGPPPGEISWGVPGPLPQHYCKPRTLQQPRADRAETQLLCPRLLGPRLPACQRRVPCTTGADSTFPGSRPPPTHPGREKEAEEEEEGRG